MVDWKASTQLFRISQKESNNWFDMLQFCLEVKVDAADEIFSRPSRVYEGVSPDYFSGA